MVRMINKLTGTEMWVAEERTKEYEAAGHKLAADESAKPVKELTPAAKKRVAKK